MNFTLVQILVVVANIQVGTLKIQVEKGFMRTVYDHKLVDPKVKINLVNDLIWVKPNKRLSPIPKGKQVKILALLCVSGNTNESEDVGAYSRESYLFLLTHLSPF